MRQAQSLRREADDAQRFGETREILRATGVLLLLVPQSGADARQQSRR
jgi:hypothetical protein